MKIAVAFGLIASLFGCGHKDNGKLDGDGMVYVDREYRTDYANTLDFDSAGARIYWAAAFLGYSEEGLSNSKSYTEKLFSSLTAEQRNNIRHIELDGDEYYLIVPRYFDNNDICDPDSERVLESVANGDAFILRCNISDIHANTVIKLDAHGGAEFSPSMSGEGKAEFGEYVLDITEYNN